MTTLESLASGDSFRLSQETPDVWHQATSGHKGPCFNSNACRSLGSVHYLSCSRCYGRSSTSPYIPKRSCFMPHSYCNRREIGVRWGACCWNAGGRWIWVVFFQLSIGSSAETIVPGCIILDAKVVDGSGHVEHFRTITIGDNK